MINKIEFGGNGKLAFDLKKITSFIQDDSKLAKETEILDSYEIDENGVPKLASKSTREAKSNASEQFSTMKYDLIKLLMLAVLNNNDNENGFSEFGSGVSFNTLLENNFLYEINE